MDQRAADPTASIRRTASRFEGGGGRSLFRRSWLSPDPARVLVVVHGFAEHSGRYDHLGVWFAERGCTVCSYDQQGHGLSPGPRGHVARFGDFLDDLAALLVRVRRESPSLPCTLIGHSMGGLVVTAFARERQPDVFAVVTSGATLSLSPDQSRAKLRAARLVRRIVPRLALAAGLDPQALSRDPDVVQGYLEDPLVDGRISTSLAVELVDAAERSADGGRDVRVPMLLLHGADDPLCLPGGSERFFASLPADEIPGSELRIYPGLRHEIFNEPEQASVFDDLHGWLTKLEAGR